MTGRDDDRRVEDLRDQLRALGYLDARVDRFVLAGGRRRSAGGAALGAGARIGLLAGALLGPAAVLGLRVRVPGLVTSAADAIVLALYLLVLFALATGIVAAIGILLGSGLARRAGPVVARRLAAGAGLAVALATFVYLLFWWRAADPASGLALLPTTGMLVVASAISLLLGHAVIVSVLAWLAQTGLGRSLPRGLPLSSWRALAVLGVGAIGGGLALLLAAGAPVVEAPPALVVVPTGERVVVLAIDGVDAETFRRLDADGRLPTLSTLLGSSVATVSSGPDRDPARVWTTIATGQPPERHGITGLETRQVAGIEGRFRPSSRLWSLLTAATDVLRLTRPAVASGSERRAPTFWEVAARAGLRTAVLHWWATWPASPDQGVVLTDRAMLRLEHGGELDREISPPELYEALRVSWPERRTRARQVVAAELSTDGIDREPAEALRRSAELDATLIDLAADPVLGPLDLLVVYLPGLDIAQHALLGDAAGSLTPSAAASRLAAVERYYGFLDRALISLVSASGDAGSATLVFGVTQPGRVSAPGAGLVGLAGNAAAAGRPTADATAIAGTVLHALGVPVAADLATGPVLDLFAPGFIERHPVRQIATYGPASVAPRTGSGRALDQEMIERMRSLGYLR